MVTRIGAGLCILALLLVVARRDDMAAVAAQQSSRPDQVVDPKSALLERLGQQRRPPIEYRGDRDGQQRIKWEWCKAVTERYLFVKELLLAEASVGREHSVREQWFFRDVTLTFQELFPLPPGHDDKLFPPLLLRRSLERPLGRHGKDWPYAARTGN